MTATEQSADERRADALRDRCTRHLSGHGRRAPADVLEDIRDELGAVVADRYGSGGVVAELEQEMGALLGKPAAVFMPSGTMAQQVALRVHADRIGRRTVLYHPTCHLELHEGQALTRLHGLIGRPVGDRSRLISAADLEGVAEYAAVLLLELPQREIGGQLPSWDELVAQIALAHSHGTTAHLDGARLLECAPHYGRPPADVAALFDSVYVSLYKGLGGVAGCVLAGDEQLVAEAREWRTRHGGTLFGMWPYAAAGLAGLRRRGPRMAAYVDHARAIATELSELDDVELVPDPPATNMMHVYLRAPAERLTDAMRRLAEDEHVWTWSKVYPTERSQWQVVELTAGDATLEWSASEVREVVSRLLASAA